MKTSAVAAALLALALCMPAFAQVDSGMHMGHAPDGAPAMSGASQAYMDAMDRMDEAMSEMDMTGRADDDFARMMIPHHQAAIDMAKSYLSSGGTDPDLARMSKEVIASQEQEIAILKAWLAKHGEAP